MGACQHQVSWYQQPRASSDYISLGLIQPPDYGDLKLVKHVFHLIFFNFAKLISALHSLVGVNFNDFLANFLFCWNKASNGTSLLLLFDIFFFFWKHSRILEVVAVHFLPYEIFRWNLVVACKFKSWIRIRSHELWQ